MFRILINLNESSDQCRMDFYGNCVSLLFQIFWNFLLIIILLNP